MKQVKRWGCQDCGHVNKKTRTIWVRLTNGNQAAFRVCYKCSGKVVEVSA